MIQAPTIASTHRKFWLCLLLGFLFFQGQLFAQTTISTQPTFVHNNGSGMTTFNFQNNNAFPVVITEINAVCRTTAASNWKLWYKTTPIAGAPGGVNAANGWVLSTTTQYTSTIASASNQVAEPVITGATLTIPGNTTYAIAVSGFSQTSTAGTMGYHTIPGTAPITSFTAGGCTLISGNNVGYGYTSETTTSPINLRGFCGSVTFISAATAGCATATYPAATPAEASPTTLCSNGNVDLDINVTLPPVIGLTYQWEWSTTTTGPWTAIGAPVNNPAITATGVSSSRYFRCRIICDGTTTVWTSGNSPQVVVNAPSLTSTTPGTRCGPGTVQLSATAPSSTVIKWYANPTGGAPLFTGGNFTTPFIPATTNFYAAGTSGSSPDSIAIALATGNTTGVYHHMFMVEALNGVTVNDISIKCNNAVGASTDWEVYYRPDNYQSVPGANTSATGWTLVATSTGVLSAGSNAYTTIATGLGIAIPSGQTYSFYIAPGASTTHQYSAPAIGTVTATTLDAELIAGNRGSSLFNCTTNGGMATVKINYSTGCEGPRVAVPATVTPPPALTLVSPTVLCSNTIGQLSITTPLSNYSNYSWTPTTGGLYTNAAATTPYTGGSATTLYFRSTDAGNHQYYLYATNTGGAQCAFADTADIWVQPDSVVIKAIPDTICNSGTATLSLVPGEDYFAGSIQWQNSTDGVSYTDIAGATAVSYTTPNLTTNRYYRARVSSVAGTYCQQPTKLVVVAHPELDMASIKDSFNCGPGEVTLQAATAINSNSSVKWYDSPTAEIPVGEGNPWTTPYLGATTTYYVAASSGTPQPPATILGTATTTTTAGASPYYRAFWSNKVQYLVTANELTTAGFSAGLITSIGFDVTTAGTALQNMYISLKNSTTTGLTTTFEPNMQPGYTAASYTPVANSVNVHNLQTPFYWDGTSNLVIEVCHNNTSTGTTSAVRYSSVTGGTHYHYASVANHCTNPSGTSNFTSTTRPNIQIGMQGACESAREEVTAFIHPKPEVDLGSDVNECVDPGHVEVLNAGYQPNTPVYTWDNGSSSQVRTVTQSGTYSVMVENQYGCIGYDTIGVTLRPNPVVELGNDTVVCNGVVLTLDAGDDGIEYFWNTGQVTSEINVSSSGSYNVFVTNGDGCVKTDTITVTMEGQLPTIQGIQISNNGQFTFQFTAVNPQNVIGYEWDFGDGSPPSYQASPIHTYANAGDYIVVLNLMSTCGFYNDSTSAHIVGINQLDIDQNELTIFPNPTQGKATIWNKGALKMEKVSLYNVLGQVVYTAKADSNDKHELRLSGLAAGLYTVEIFTDKGTVSRKLEVVK